MNRRIRRAVVLLLPWLLFAGGATVVSAGPQPPPEPPDRPPESDRVPSEQVRPEQPFTALDESAGAQDEGGIDAAPAHPSSQGRIPLGEPVVVSTTGPLFALRPIVERLGGRLVELEESITLMLDDTEVIAGPDNPVMLIGREIVRLSQAPAQGEPLKEGLLVPVDFLRQSYGRLTGYDIRWSEAERELSAVHRPPRTLPVTVDVVHLQGVSTVVLQFPERLDYRIEERDEDYEILSLRDELASGDERVRVRDPLVRDVRVAADRVHLDLAAGTSAESYVLQDPFRLVFDVVRGESRAEADPDREALEPPEPREGLDVVVIDPGHGGTESGAVGPNGRLEKDLSLEIARRLRDRLRQRLPVKVVLTRNEDAHLPLDTRSAIANQNKADLFISIHLNSSRGAGAHGAETYFLSMEASDSRAARTAELENSVAGAPQDEALFDLQLILWDLAQSYHLSASQRVANLIQEELNDALGLRNRGVKQAPFRVLMGAAMPAVLVELGFLSNPQEEARLEDPAYRADLVNALVRAIGRFRSEVEASDDELTAGTPQEPLPEGVREPSP